MLASRCFSHAKLLATKCRATSKPLTNSLRGMSKIVPTGITHEVLNQSEIGVVADSNLFSDDEVLVNAYGAFDRGGGWAEEGLRAFGAAAGSVVAVEERKRAMSNIPRLRRFDIQGRPLRGTVEYDPAYHAIMKRGIEAGVPSLAWSNHGRPGAHVARSVLGMLQYQSEPGTSCPMSMTFAGVPALLESPEVAEKWVPKLVAGVYDGREVPVSEKGGATVGMSMTEKQSGSDVATNTTQAEAVQGGGFVLRGHKWFTSAPMSDGFLTLAQTSKGLSCFLVPRWLPDGSENAGLQFQQLKEKLGDKSNASSEVHYDNAWGELVGEEGRGVPTIIHMVQATRLDCALGSAALMRQAVRLAARHCRSRIAFGKKLSEQPLMQSVIVDLAVETELAVLSALGVAAAFDDCAIFAPAQGLAGETAQTILGRHTGLAGETAQNVLGRHTSNTTQGVYTDVIQSPEDLRAFRRLLTAVIKYHVCKRAPAVTVEALECLGGNGFVEDFGAAAIYRQAPLNSIWEGSGNVQALDILRTAAKEPNAIPTFLAVLQSVQVSSTQTQRIKRLLTHAKSLSTMSPDQAQRSARYFAEELATAFQWYVAQRFGSPHLVQVLTHTRDKTDPLNPNTCFGAWHPDESMPLDAIQAILDRT